MRGSTNRSGETAATLILIGLVLQAIEVAVLLGLGLLFLVVPFLGALVLGLALVGILWVILVYLFSYTRTRLGEYEAARTPTLVFAILSLLTINLISGVLYIVAYAKLGDAAEGSSRTLSSAWGTAPVAPTASGYGKRCNGCGRANAPAASFCAGCGNPLF